MIRQFFACAFLFVASAVHAEPVATLTSPADMLNLRSEAADVTVYYAKAGQHLEVTMLFSDETGSLLRARVKLDDRQSHGVTLSDSDDRHRTTYRVERNGGMVGVYITESDANQKLAAR